MAGTVPSPRGERIFDLLALATNEGDVMTSTLERYDTAARGFRRRLEPLVDADFDRTSPCEGWTAGALVDHGTGVLELVANLVGDPLDEDPAASRLDRFNRAAL